MPYISPERRKAFDNNQYEKVKSVGELNYLITLLCINWTAEQGLSYKTLNDVVGVLECAKQEFYRKVVAPYEEEKEHENGSVY
jgi:hypothetical protein